MTAHHEPTPRPLDGPCPDAISLETLAVVEEVLAQAARSLRERLRRPGPHDPGELEYQSWMRGARR